MTLFTQSNSKRRVGRGFTLIEMIVATFLLAIVFVAVAETFGTVTRANSKAEALQTSALLARKRFAEVEQQVSSLSGGDTEGDFGDGYPGYKWRQSVVASDFEKLYKATLTITHGDSSSSTDQYEYATYFSTDQNASDEQIRQQQKAQGIDSPSSSSAEADTSGTGSTTGGGASNDP